MTPAQLHEIDLRVVARIRQARKAAKISQKTLAAEANVSMQQLSKAENGINRVSASALFAYANALGKPVEWFFREEHEQ